MNSCTPDVTVFLVNLIHFWVDPLYNYRENMYLQHSTINKISTNSPKVTVSQNSQNSDNIAIIHDNYITIKYKLFKLQLVSSVSCSSK